MSLASSIHPMDAPTTKRLWEGKALAVFFPFKLSRQRYFEPPKGVFQKFNHNPLSIPEPTHMVAYTFTPHILHTNVWFCFVRCCTPSPVYKLIHSGSFVNVPLDTWNSGVVSNAASLKYHTHKELETQVSFRTKTQREREISWTGLWL